MYPAVRSFYVQYIPKLPVPCFLFLPWLNFLFHYQCSFPGRFFQNSRYPVLVDGPDDRGGYLYRNPAVFFRNIKFLFLKIGIKFPLGLNV